MNRARALWVTVGVAGALAIPVRAVGGPCPPEMPGGCRGFLSAKNLALTAVLGTGVDASPIEAVGATPDGKIGYGLRRDGALDAWDLATGALRRVAIARFIALDPLGRWAVASQPRKDLPDRAWSEHGSALELWDLASRRRVAVAKVEWEHPLDFLFSPRVLVWGYLGNSSESWIWDIATGKVRTPPFGFCAGFAVVTPDGKHAVCSAGAGDDDDSRGGAGVALWDLDRLKIERRTPARAFENGGQVAGLAVSADGGKALVLLAHGEYSARTSVVWNLSNGQIAKGPDAAEGSGASVRWSPDGKRMILIGGEGRPGVVLCPGDKGKPIWLGTGHEGVVDAVFLPDGKRILTGDGKGVMRLAAAADARELRASREMSGHTGAVVSLSVSRDGKRLLSSEKGNLKLWDLQSNKPVGSVALDANAVRSGALMTPDGAYAIADLKGLSVLALPQGTLRLTLVGDRNASVRAMSPDGTLVAVTAMLGTTLWEIPSGREVWSTSAANGAAAFSADQQRLYVSAQYKGLVTVIDATSGVVKTTLGDKARYGQSPGHALAVGPREDFLLVAPDGFDPAVRIEGEHDVVTRLDLPTGEIAWKIPVRHYVRALAISPDGRWFVVTGTVHFAGDKDDLLKRFPARLELRATADGSVVDAVDLDSAGLSPYAAAFTPDGRTLIVGSEQGPILRFALTP